MAEQTPITLDKLRQALAQPNTAIRKRALAIIYNEVKVEAASLLEEYLGRETDTDLQALAIKVLEKLRSFSESAGHVPTERLVLLLQNPDPSARLLGLRAIATRRAPELAKIVARYCSEDPSAESQALVAQILRNNPTPGATPLLLKLVTNETENIRQDAIEGILNIITQCLYPEVLKTLLDPSSALKMRAYQLISNISRANLLEALEAMFDSIEPETNRLGGKLLPSFLNPDLIPLLKKHATHRDAETAALCKRALLLLAQKGHFEAVQLIEKLAVEGNGAKSSAVPSPSQAAGTPPDSTHQKPGSTRKDTVGTIQKLIAGFPEFMQTPLHGISNSEGSPQIILRLKELYRRVRDMLAGPLITTFFIRSRRSQGLDRIAFRALQQGMARTDLLTLMKSLAPAFESSRDGGDLYPITIAYRSQNSFDDHFLESLQLLQDAFRSLDSRMTDPAGFVAPIIRGSEEMLAALDPIRANKLVVKCNDASGIKILDFVKSPAIQVDPRLLVNFDLPMNVPTLISGNSSSAVSLAPFLKFDPTVRCLARHDPSEHDLWEYLMSLQILDAYLLFLKEKPA